MWRLIIGALIASSIVLLHFSPVGNVAGQPIIKVLYSVVIVLVAFGFKRFRFFFQNFFMFYFVTFMVGGGMLGLHYFFQSEAEWVSGAITTYSSGFGDPVSWGMVLIGFPLLWYFSKYQISTIETKKLQFDQIVEVDILIDNVHISVKGLIDTGNQLFDPISKTPVMILDVNQVTSHIPKSIIECSKNVEHLHLIDEMNPWLNRIRVIPYRGVGQDHQFLAAVKPDYVKVYHNGQIFKISRILIGLSHSTFSTDGEYTCILHPKMVTESNVCSVS